MTTFNKEKQQSMLLASQTKRVCVLVSTDLWMLLRSKAQQANIPFGEWVLKALCEASEKQLDAMKKRG